MFGGNQSKENTPKRTTSSGGSLTPNNSLVHGTRVEGSIFTENDIRIDGKLVGNLNCKGKVIIGPSGEIEGEIQCKNAVVEGRFSGLFVISELLHVRESATVEGEINTAKLIVQSGSVFNVTCKMGGQKIKEMKPVESKKLVLEELSKVASH